MTRNRQHRIRLTLADGIYNISEESVEGLKVPSYTRVQGNINDKSAVQIIRPGTRGRGFEIGTGSILEGLSISVPIEEGSDLPSPGGPIEHPVFIREAYPDPAAIQNCRLEGGEDTVIIGEGSIAFMYDVDFTCVYDGIRGDFGDGLTKPMRLTMVSCRGTHLRRSNALIKTSLQGPGVDAPAGSLFDFYNCEFTRAPELPRAIPSSSNSSHLIGLGDSWGMTTMPALIPVRMKQTTCRVIVPEAGVVDGSGQYADLATIFLAFNTRFEFDNCTFEIDETASGPQKISTMVLLDGAEGYALDCTANPPGRINQHPGASVHIDPPL